MATPIRRAAATTVTATIATTTATVGTPSPLQHVRDALTACIDASGNLHVPGTFLASTALQICWDVYFAGKTFDVAGATVTLNAGDVTVAGTGQGLFSGLAISAQFTFAGNDLGVTITGTVPASWSLTQAFPVLANTIFARIPVTAGGTLTLKNAAAAGSGGPSGSLAFTGALDVAAFSADLASIVGHSVAFTGTIAVAKNVPTFTLKTADSTWTLPIGSGLPLSKAHVEFAYDGKPSAKLSGTLVIDADTSVVVDWTLPTTLHIVGNIAGTSVLKLAGALHGSAIPLPPSFNIPLPTGTISISKEGGAYAFDVAADAAPIGQAMFTAKKAAGGAWGYGFGIDLSVDKLSKVPGLAALSKLEDVVALRNLLLVVGSNIDASTDFPDAKEFTAAKFPVKGITIPKQAGGIKSGLNVYADVDLNQNAVTKQLVKLAGIKGTLGAAISIPPDPSNGTTLTASLAGTAHGATITGSLGVLVQRASTAVTFKGTAATTIRSQPVTFTVAAAFVANGVFLAGTMQGRITFGHVTLSNLAIEIGVDDEGVPSFGVAGQIDVNDFESSIAIFFDSADPSHSMYAGSISPINLAQGLKSFAGNVGAPIPPAVLSVLDKISISGTGGFTVPATPLADALAARDAKAVSAAFGTASPPAALPTSSDKLFISEGKTAGHWFVTNLASLPPTHYELKRQDAVFSVSRNAQIYNVPQKTSIGELSFDAGFALSGTLSVCGVTATADVRIIENTGISATASLAKLVIGNEKILVISNADGTAGPIFSVSTYADALQTDPNLQGPHVYISGKVSLLGLSALLYVDLQPDGFHFTIGSSAGASSITIHATITSASGFTASGTATVGIDRTIHLGKIGARDLGNIALKASVSCTLAISASSGHVSASFTASFTFGNHTFTLAALVLDVDTAALSAFADAVAHEVEKAIKDFVTADVDRWLNWVNANIIAGFKDAPAKVGAVLADAYHQSANEIAADTRQVLGYGADAAAAALKGANTAANEAAKALSSAGYAAGEIGDAISKAFKGIHADVSAGHVDVPPGPHADAVVSPHVDTHAHADIVPTHGDVMEAPHVDRHTHADTGNTHVDTGSNHVDTGSNHVDTGSNHVDTGTHHGDAGHGRFHVDTGTPHGDTGTPHFDTGTPHADTATPHVDTGAPHADTSPHLDTPALHTDTHTSHVDATTSHADIPALHTDTHTSHVDTGTHIDTKK